ncbi:MAG: Ribose-phosphate pyrophosphokinase [Holosporales bacterium]
MPIYLNGKKITSSLFASGECYIKVHPKNVFDHNVIIANLKNSDDILSLLFAVNAMRHIKTHVTFDLEIPYFPYARQDRIVQKGEAFSLQVIAKLINDLNPASVKIWDPHSKILERTVHNCTVISQEMIVKQSVLFDFIKSNSLQLVCPDDGAYHKIEALKALLFQHGCTPHVVYGSKKRDEQTGSIVQTIIKNDVHPIDALIIDDICDQGTTLLNLAKMLKHRGAQKIFLYVTHGLFSNGIMPLRDFFSHIYCYHLLSYDVKASFLTVLKK